ncbi:MAG: hypothetical protein WBG48_07855 [Pricia sp.]
MLLSAAKLVKYDGAYVINVSGLSQGTYFISAKDRAGKEHHKPLIIKR